jgi:DNA-binding transcriptional LysR family regulator
MDSDDGTIRQLDLTDLLVFREVIREGRMSIAAKRLGLSQPAVSHALTRLRAAFDDPLFLRQPNGLEPTSRSLELLPKLETLLDLARETLGIAESFEPATTPRTFRLAGNDLVAALIAAPLASDLHRAAPSARLAFRAAAGAECLEALRRNDIDLALGTFASLPEGFAATPLFQESFVVIARKGHPQLRHGMALETYAALDHLIVSFLGDFTGRADYALRREGLTRRVAASVPMFFAAFATAAQSDLIATVPARLAGKYARAFGLDVFAPPVALDPFEVVALRHARSSGDGALDWLIGRIVHLTL